MRRLLVAVLAAACATAPVAPPAAPVVQAPPPPAWVRTPPPGPLPSAKLAAAAVTRKTLPNGLRLIVVEQHRRKVAVVNLVLPKGSLRDPAGDEGLTYMAVHLASDFHELGGGFGDEKSFRMEIARLGGVSGFQVESDFSQIEIAGYSQDVPTYLKLLSAELHHPRHGARSFHQRRNFTMDAVEDAESSDTASFRLLLNRTAFGQGHPYATAPYGTVKGLSHLRLKDVESQQRFIFDPAGATLLVVGDVQPAEVIANATELLSDWKTRMTDPDADVVPEPSVPRPSLPHDSKQIQYLARPTASTMMTCATRPLPEVPATNATLRVLVAVLGEGLTSRLNQTLRNDNGLTYGADAQIVRRRLASALIACSAIDSSRAAEGARVFRQVLASLKDKPPGDEEIARAKGVVLSRIDASSDDVQRSVTVWLEAIAYGDGTPHLEQERAAVANVSAREVRDLAARLFKLENFRWVVSGDRAVAVKAFEGTGLGKLAQTRPAN
jgi:zinc protease